jgi:Leucine-rich repeat (LRR) protein
MNNIYRTELGSLRNLKTLILEKCCLDIFAPRELSDELTFLSLEGNKLDKIEVEFGVNKDDYLMEGVLIETLNLSSN